MTSNEREDSLTASSYTDPRTRWQSPSWRPSWLGRGSSGSQIVEEKEKIKRAMIEAAAGGSCQQPGADTR